MSISPKVFQTSLVLFDMLAWFSNNYGYHANA